MHRSHRCIQRMDDEWIAEEGVDFNRIAKAFCNLVEKIHLANMVLKAKFAETVISLISRSDWKANLERQKMMKRPKFSWHTGAASY